MTIHNAGSLNIDDVFRTSHIVRPGETIPGQTLERFAGGKGLNQSTALARAGAAVRHVGRIGSDGLFLKNGLAADGVDVSGVLETSTPTGHAVIQVAESGENAIVLYGGANRDWSRADVQRMLDGAQKGDILLLQNEVNGIPELMNAAAEAGMRLAMNPAPMGAEVRTYPLEKLSWLVVNEIEGRELAGFPGEHSAAEDEAVVRRLQSLYPRAVVVMTLGKRGVICADNGELLRESFPDQGPVVDTTGAGDTFMGYFLASESAGNRRAVSLRRACAAGALAVTRPGASPAIPRAAEVDKVMPSGA